MDIKGMLKGIDWKGIALRHCEKAGIAIVTCLLLLFLVKGVKKSFDAGGVKAEEIAILAADLEDKLAKSLWDEAVAEREGVKNPEIERQLAQLSEPIDVNKYELRDKRLFPWTDFGNILRSKPEILTPYDLLALADRGAISLYKVDAKGKFQETELKVAIAGSGKKPDEEDKPKGKKTAEKPGAKGGEKGKSGGMMERMKGMSGGGAGDSGMADRYKGMQRGMSGGMMGGMMGGMSMGGGGAGAGGAGEDSGGAEGSQIGASQIKRSSSASRNPGSNKKRVADAAVEAAVKGAKPGDKPPTAIKIKQEEIKGVRWVVATALFPYMKQVAKYNDALNTRLLNQPDEPPDFHDVKVERRYLQKNGELSDWQPLDAKMYEKFLRLVPATEDPRRRQPEDPDMVAARAIFQKIVMPLPELAAGEWWGYDREDALNAARESGQNLASRGPGGGGDEQDFGGDSGNPFGGARGDDLGAMAGAGRALGMGGAIGGVGGATGPNPGLGMGGPLGGVGGAPPGGQMPAMGMGGPMGGAGRMPMGGGGGAPAGGMGGMGGQQMGNLRGEAGGLAGGGGKGAGTGNAGKGAGTPGEKKPVQRTNAELIQVRFIDYKVEPEHTYQYRFKIVVKNPNYKNRAVVDPEFKKAEFLESEEWSDPSPPVFVPADTEYFVLQRGKIREEATLQVHRWLEELGDWNLRDFPAVKPGDPIGAKVKEHTIVNWDGAAEKRDFDFFSEDLLLDVSGGERQFTFVGDDGRDTTYYESMPAEILVVDRLGDLATRNQDFDKNDVTRKEREKYLADLKSKVPKKDDKESKKAGGKSESGKDFNEELPSRSKGGSSGSGAAKGAN